MGAALLSSNWFLSPSGLPHRLLHSATASPQFIARLLDFANWGVLGTVSAVLDRCITTSFGLVCSNHAANPGQSMSRVMCLGNERTAYRWWFESESTRLISFGKFLLDPLFFFALAPSFLFLFLGAALCALRPLLRAGCA
jgi:hypothetical protein